MIGNKVVHGCWKQGKFVLIEQPCLLFLTCLFQLVNKILQQSWHCYNAGKLNLVRADQLNHVHAGQLNLVYAGQHNIVHAGQVNVVHADQHNIVHTGQLNIVQTCQQAVCVQSLYVYWLSVAQQSL